MSLFRSGRIQCRRRGEQLSYHVPTRHLELRPSDDVLVPKELAPAMSFSAISGLANCIGWGEPRAAKPIIHIHYLIGRLTAMRSLAM